MTVPKHHVRLSAGVTLPLVWGGETRVQQVVTSRGALEQPCVGAAGARVALVRARNARRDGENRASVRAEKRRTEKTRRAELRASEHMKEMAKRLVQRSASRRVSRSGLTCAPISAPELGEMSSYSWRRSRADSRAHCEQIADSLPSRERRAFAVTSRNSGHIF